MTKRTKWTQALGALAVGLGAGILTTWGDVMIAPSVQARPIPVAAAVTPADIDLDADTPAAALAIAAAARSGVSTARPCLVAIRPALDDTSPMAQTALAAESATCQRQAKLAASQ